jgi:lipocalin
MKFRISFKDPDAIYDAVVDAVGTELDTLNLPEDEAYEVEDIRVKKALEVCSDFFEYGEYCVIEVDTEAKTAIVVKPS